MDFGLSFKSIAKTITMFRFIILCCFLTRILTTRAEDDFGDKFTGLSVNSSQCESISGSGSGCYECYTCDSREMNLHQRKHRTFINLEIFDGNCTGTQVCCISQSEFRSRNDSPQCGISNPQGEPRRVRDSLRSVLPGQYPWRTWIYTVARPDEPICGGVFVDKSTQSIITLASCVINYDKLDLEVKFSKSEASLKVREVFLHELYDEEKGTDNIAVLFLANDAIFPEWASDVCLSNLPPRFPSACIAISDNDKYINTIIPIQNLCFSKTESVHESQICAGTPPFDYEPELGGGLFCETELIKNRYQYVVHGIYAYKNKYNDSMFTDVSKYFDWLEKKFENKN